MKVKAKFLTNEDELRAADRSGMEIPEKFVWGDFYFDARLIHAAHKSEEGNIQVYLPSGTWTLKYNEELWERITAALSQQGL